MIIAIDGPAAAGKGTLARRIAETLDFAHLDTGLIYRAVARKAVAAGATDQETFVKIAEILTPEDLRQPGMRAEEVSQTASRVAAIPAVRAALLDFQRHFAERPPGDKRGAVLDGRDIGTVVCPGATVKFFVTASPEARAGRRHKELLERGDASIYARVLQEMRDRDARDSGRAAAPLRPAEDAIVLDTTELTADAVLKAALKVIASRRSAESA